MTDLPPGVAILDRKPWVLTRLILLGWYVLFMLLPYNYDTGDFKASFLKSLLSGLNSFYLSQGNYSVSFLDSRIRYFLEI